MDKTIRKIYFRLTMVGGHALHQVMPVFGQFLISFLVIRYADSEVWGEVVAFLIVINLAVMFLQWGQNTFLLRAFGENSNIVSSLWQESFLSRSLLFFPVMMAFFLIYRDEHQLLMSMVVWVLLVFVFRSFDPIHLYIRKFKGLVLLELLNLLQVH